MRRLTVAMTVALVAGGCGAREAATADELAAVTHVLGLPPEAVTVVGRDVPADAGPDADPRLDLLELAVSAGRQLPIGDAPPLPDPATLARDTLAFGATSVRLEEASQVVALVIPLLDPTRSGMAFEVRLVAVGPDGAVLGTDLGSPDTLDRVVAGEQDPAGVLAETVEALRADTLGRDLTDRQRQLLDRLGE